MKKQTLYTYEMDIQMKCQKCDTSITFNIQPLIGDYYEKECPMCGDKIFITGQLVKE